MKIQQLYNCLHYFFKSESHKSDCTSHQVHKQTISDLLSGKIVAELTLPF